MNYTIFWRRLTALYDEGEAKAIARMVFEVCLGMRYTDMLLGEECKEEQVVVAEEMLSRLLKGEPVQYVTGRAMFCDREFTVAPGVLIPRPETEELTQRICSWAREQYPDDRNLTILDCCTGSGCIAISLALDMPGSEVWAFDISEAALAIARKNARGLGAKVNFFEADALEMEGIGHGFGQLTNNGFSQLTNHGFDIIVSNPPYVCEREKEDMERNVLEYEPHEALFVPDDDAIRFYKAIGRFAARRLNTDGNLWFEINPNYVDEIADFLLSEGFGKAEVITDSFGKKRFVHAYEIRRDNI